MSVQRATLAPLACLAALWPVRVHAQCVAFYNGQNGSGYSIGRAVSANANCAGGFVRSPSTPVLTAGPGAYDAQGVFQPSAIQRPSDSYMLYTSYPGGVGHTISVATSTNQGATWTKYGGNPVLAASLPWEGTALDGVPTFLYDATDPNPAYRYKLWYGTSASGQIPNPIGYAYSANGLNWTKRATPALTNGVAGSPDSNFMGPGAIWKDESTSPATYYLYYYCTGPADAYGSPWNSCYATTTDPLNGVYTKAITNPTLRHNGVRTTTTALVSAGATTLPVLTTAAFTVGEYVMVGNCSVGVSNVTHAKILSKTATLLGIDHAVLATYTAGSAVRSVLSEAVGPSMIWQDGGLFRMLAVPFSSFGDCGYLLEDGAFFTGTSPADPSWAPDWPNSLFLQSTPGTWDRDSRENPRIMWTAAPTFNPSAPTATHTPTPTSMPTETPNTYPTCTPPLGSPTGAMGSCLGGFACRP